MLAQFFIIPGLAGFRNLPGLLLLGLALGSVPDAAAQASRFCGAETAPAVRASEQAPPSMDVRGLKAVYCTESDGVRHTLRWAHASAYPVFYGGLPAAWAGALFVRGTGDVSDAYRLTVTQLATYGAVVGLKRTIRRPRPYMTLPLSSRAARYGAEIEDGQRASMPSGHAGLSVALATSWSLSHPQWYVVAPSALWASAVTVSRLYLGVHYPSDVLAGALLGAGIATLVHVLGNRITPDALTSDSPEQALSHGPGINLSLRF